MRILLVLFLFTCSCSCETLYETLGVSKSASVKEIKKAYVKLAYEWHPDKNKDPDAPKMMAKINHAYEVLSDDDRRRHYDLIGDDSESPGTESPFSGSHKSRQRTNQYSSSPEPTNEISAKEFDDQVLSTSETIPYLVYFFHDFCTRCEFWTEKLESMRPDLEVIGVKTASINVIINSRVATYSGIYIHEVPKVAMVINKKVYIFKGLLELDELKDFVYRQLPSSTIEAVVDIDVMSIKTRISRNKPMVLLVSPRVSPSLNYKMMSFTYRNYLDFYFFSSSSSVTPSNDDLLKRLNLTREAKYFYIFSDMQEPAAILKDDGLTREATNKKLEKNKLLTLPRVSNCDILDLLCPGGPNTRWCALLITADYFDKTTGRFRDLTNRWNDKKFNMGYLNGYQQSSLMSAVCNQSHAPLSAGTCDNGGTSKEILVLHRLTQRKLEFDWYHRYCGTDEDDSSLLRLLQRGTLNQHATMDSCEFEEDVDPDNRWHRLPQWLKVFLTWFMRNSMEYWEKISAFVTLPLPLLLMSLYLFLCPLRQPQLQPRPVFQRNEGERDGGPGENVQTGGRDEVQEEEISDNEEVNHHGNTIGDGNRPIREEIEDEIGEASDEETNGERNETVATNRPDDRRVKKHGKKYIDSQ